MKDILESIFGFLYALSMGDYIFLIGTFILILVFIYIIYLIKKDNENKIDDLNSIKEHIEKEYKPANIELTEYEQEQEESAIISYEELIKTKNNITMSYDEEYKPVTNEINIKKININGENNNIENSKIEVKLMNYDNYENFLKALKQLQNNLN